MRYFLLSYGLLLVICASAQESYFDFWAGYAWKNEYSLYKGDTIRDNSSYQVVLNKNRIEEIWNHLEGSQNIEASVIRVYDQIDSAWFMIYQDHKISTTWRSVLEEGIPKFVKKFTLSDRNFYSRQFWKPLDSIRVLHVIEHSKTGEEWTEVYRSILRKDL